MAINGAWRALQSGPQPVASERVWGTGINPVHAKYAGGNRNVMPNVYPGDSSVPDNLVGDFPDGAYGYTSEDSASFYGYGVETGTADRPNIGESNRGRRAQTTNNYPSSGGTVTGVPKGTRIRSREHGGRLSWRSKLLFPRPIYQGTLDKDKGDVLDSQPAADSQLVIQTSMVQRDRTRAGSQRSGSQSEYRAPIHSRIVGMRIPQQVGGERHEDMRPRQQSVGNRRPFYYRTGGTGDAELMRVNAAYESRPMTRTPPNNPYAGEEVGTVTQQLSYTADGGYTSEDPVWS